LTLHVRVAMVCAIAGLIDLLAAQLDVELTS